jgi:tagatose 1,6-diphosphate aldolase
MNLLETPVLVDGELELHLVEHSPADPARNWVPAYRFEMRVAGQRVGTISLRVGDTAYIRRYAGHIGYGVDPEHRGHHYAARATRMLFPLARKHGMTTLWITCNPENVASRRTCERVGGELVDIVDLPVDSDMYREGERQKCRYRVRL